MTAKVEKEQNPAPPNLTPRPFQIKIAIINYTMLGFFLFYSEFINAVFNNLLDSRGIPLAQRIAFTFKPSVVILYFIFASILFTIIIRQLRPLFSWMNEPVYQGNAYRKARTAAIRIPRNILIFQILAWSAGTTIYYILHGFQAESGIPYIFGLLAKLSVGIISGMFTAILINLTLLPAKRKLHIQSMRRGEDERFSRTRETLVLLSASFYLVVTLSYIAYYYARSGQIQPDPTFYFSLFAVSLAGILASAALMALSRREYHIQIRSVQNGINELARESSDLNKRINILTFNELGEIAQGVNRILDNFKTLMEEIRNTSQTISGSTSKLSSSAQENASYANEQASATSEVVSTMENVNDLSRKVDEQVDQVADHSDTVNKHVQDGFATIHQNIEQMDSVKASYAETSQEIYSLAGLIDGIGEIVKLINGIADQIKIIAFNATLEASAAGEAGKNFEIVATEIRRLADNTVVSTKEIKTIIENIEHTSNKLADLSEQDSQKIQEAWKMSQKIESLFSQIQEASEASAGSAQEIQGSVDQQVNAFEQILTTMRQISSAIDQFSGSIDENSSTAAELDQTVKVLHNIMGRYGQKD